MYNKSTRKKKTAEEITEVIMAEECPKLNARQQITYPRSSENTKKDKYQKSIHLGISYLNCRKIETKKNLERG